MNQPRLTSLLQLFYISEKILWLTCPNFVCSDERINYKFLWLSVELPTCVRSREWVVAAKFKPYIGGFEKSAWSAITILINLQIGDLARSIAHLKGRPKLAIVTGIQLICKKIK